MNYSSPEAKEFCIRLRALIKRLGPNAFGFHEKGVVYTGPDGRIKAIVGSGVPDNVARSITQAHEFRAIRIDETRIGKLLDRIDLVFYFSKFPGFDDNLIKAAIFDVWSCASREFVRSSFKHASTAVCGGSKKRVFRKHELKVAVTQRTAIETINSLPLQHFRDIYEKYKKPSDGFYAVFTEICQTELDLFRKLAITVPADAKKEAWKEHDMRKLFFNLEQALTATGTVKKALASMTGHRKAIAGTAKRSAHRALSKSVPGH